MPIINITVRNKIAVNPLKERYVCGNSDYIVRFDFDSEWDAHETKTARFIKEDGTYRDQVFTGNECPMPVIENTYKINVGVYAGNLSTTTAAYVPAKKSILCGGGTPAAPEDDVYHQIMEVLNETDGKAENALATLADAWVNGGLYIVSTTYDEEKGGWVSDRTQAEIYAAVRDGKTLLLVDKDGYVYNYIGEVKSRNDFTVMCPGFARPSVYEPGFGLSYMYAEVAANGKVLTGGYAVAKTPNPYNLTFSGASSATYDGTKPVTVDIPAMPNASAGTVSYARWNGTAWETATIDQLKADLGLT